MGIHILSEPKDNVTLFVFSTVEEPWTFRWSKKDSDFAIVVSRVPSLTSDDLLGAKATTRSQQLHHDWFRLHLPRWSSEPGA